MSHVIENFIAPLRPHYDDPKDAERFFSDLAGDLNNYSPSVLNAAVNTLRRSYRYRRFPSVPECIKACNDAVSRNERPSVPAKRTAETDEGTARKMMASDIGCRAADEGWILGLYDFVLARHRFPDFREVSRIKGESARGRRVREDAMAGMYRCEETGVEKPITGPLTASIRDFAVAITKREQELVGIATGSSSTG